MFFFFFIKIFIMSLRLSIQSYKFNIDRYNNFLISIYIYVVTYLLVVNYFNLILVLKSQILCAKVFVFGNGIVTRWRRRKNNYILLKRRVKVNATKRPPKLNGL